MLSQQEGIPKIPDPPLPHSKGRPCLGPQCVKNLKLHLVAAFKGSPTFRPVFLSTNIHAIDTM
jgi:hypothetical protein